MNAEEFWSAVDKSGGPQVCWPWTRSRTSGGYGHVVFEGRLQRSHRVAYQLANKLTLPLDTGKGPRGTLVLHGNQCTTKLCCNPKHLRTGTQTDNMADLVDRIATGAWKRPRRDPATAGGVKLTWNKVRAIREKHAAGETPIALAKKFAISDSSIYLILAKKSWLE